VASLLDPSLAPEGGHVIHAYTPATEPYATWEQHGRGHSTLGSATARCHAPRLWWLTLLAMGGALHSGGAAVPPSAQWEAEARA